MNDKMPDRKELELYIPQRNDGWFYCKMVSDPETMAYNAPWFPPDGCIPNAEDEWEDLYNNWNIPDSGRFYAYLRRITDGRFVGDVNYHYDPERDRYDMGIVIYAPERGKGYGKLIMLAGIEAAKASFDAQSIDIEAQEYARGFYEQVGFKQSSDPFILDGIPHIRMTWKSDD